MTISIGRSTAVVILLFLMCVINYIDRSAVSFAAHDIQKSFGLDSSQIGIILGAFGIGYVISTLFGGLAADYFGIKWTLAISALVWSLAIGGAGIATGFLTLVAARTALGLAEGPTFPATDAAVQRIIPIEQRGRATAGALVAVPIALAIGSPVVSQLIQVFSWRTMFFILMALSLAWIPLWLMLPKPKSAEAKIKQNLEDAPPLSSLFKSPTLWANYLAYFVFGYFLFFFMTWLPEYLRHEYDLDLSTVGYLAILPWACGAVLLLLFGYLGDIIYTRTRRLRLAYSYPIAATQFLAAISVLPLTMAGDLNTAVICITLAAGLALAPNVAYYVIVADLVPGMVGRAMGVMTVFFAAAGFLAPMITGFVLKESGHFKTAFALMALIAFVSVACVLLFHHPDRDFRKLPSSTDT